MPVEYHLDLCRCAILLLYKGGIPLVKKWEMGAPEPPLVRSLDFRTISNISNILKNFENVRKLQNILNILENKKIKKEVH